MAKRIDEEALRHPLEKPIFILSVLLNVGLLILAVYLATHAPDWLESHPLVAKNLTKIKALATGMALAPFALTFARLARHSNVRANSVALSGQQLPEIYTLLEALCAKIGRQTPPGLFLSDTGISGISTSFTARRKDFIVLSSKLVEPNFPRVREVLSFTLARELGRLRFGYTKWFDELLVAYIVRIPILRDPLQKVRTLSLDRYAAALVPDGIPGLLVLASGRLIMHNVNMVDYLAQLDADRGSRSRRWIANIGRKEIPVMLRANGLYNAGLLDREADLRRFASPTAVKGWPAEPEAPATPIVKEPASPSLVVKEQVPGLASARI